MKLDNSMDISIANEDLNKIYNMIRTESWKIFTEKIIKSWLYTVNGMLTNIENTRETDLILKGNAQVLSNIIAFESILRQQIGEPNETV